MILQYSPFGFLNAHKHIANFVKINLGYSWQIVNRNIFLFGITYENNRWTT